MSKSRSTEKNISKAEKEELIEILKARFEKFADRHKGMVWEKVQARLEASKKLGFIWQMEQTGGEPDVVDQDEATGEYHFYDCSPESPKGRRSLCYDREGLESRKEHKPKGSAMEMAAEIGIQLLSEEQYRRLQQLGEFDLKTSTWVETPADVRALGGALFCDRRYGRVFLYHNGAQSYYSSRGFRGLLKV